jgi:hypothetical protein
MALWIRKSISLDSAGTAGTAGAAGGTQQQLQKTRWLVPLDLKEARRGGSGRAEKPFFKAIPLQKTQLIKLTKK